MILTAGTRGEGTEEAAGQHEIPEVSLDRDRQDNRWRGRIGQVVVV
jgi:hypothetical protein